MYEIKVIPESLRLRLTNPYCVFCDGVFLRSFFSQIEAESFIVTDKQKLIGAKNVEITEDSAGAYFFDTREEAEAYVIPILAAAAFLEVHRNSKWLTKPNTNARSGMGIQR